MTEPLPYLTPLENAVREVELHVAAAGWDQPPRLFALVPAAEALAANPGLAAWMPDVTPGEVPADRLLSVEQDDLPQVVDVAELLGHVEFSRAVAGVVVCAEHVMVPPEAEAEVAAAGDVDAVAAAAAAHPDRHDVRIVVGVHRDGATHAAIRMRDHDDPDQVLTGPDLVPAWSEALRATLSDRD